MATLLKENHSGIVEPFIVPNFGERDGQLPRTHSLEAPSPAVTSHGAGALVEPFLIAYYGTRNMSEPGEPLPTITTKPRFGLVEPRAEKYRLDIRFRMLQPRELARAQGFPDSYQFSGNREAVVKQIGNAVPPNTARALLMEVLGC